MYELTSGARTADIARAWSSWPAMKWRASCDSPYSSFGSEKALLPCASKKLWWTCMPEPLMPKRGFGMNVA